MTRLSIMGQDTPTEGCFLISSTVGSLPFSCLKLRSQALTSARTLASSVDIEPGRSDIRVDGRHMGGRCRSRDQYTSTSANKLLLLLQAGPSDLPENTLSSNSASLGIHHPAPCLEYVLGKASSTSLTLSLTRLPAKSPQRPVMMLPTQTRRHSKILRSASL